MVRLDADTVDAICAPATMEFVEVFFGRTSAEAERLCRFLRSRSIPALAERNLELPVQCGVAVLVPASKLVDASELLTRMAHDDEDDDIDFDDEEDDDDMDSDYEDDEDSDLDDDDDDADYEDDDEDLDEEDDDF